MTQPTGTSERRNLGADDRAPARGRCTPTQRGATIASFLIASVLLVLTFRLSGCGGSGGGMGGGEGTGIGTGKGSGLGPGAGTGSGKKGDGPGSGVAGAGRGAEGPDAAIAPKGNPSGTAIVDAEPPAERAPSGADAGTSVAAEVPEFGFTPPSAPPPPPPAPPPADPVGVPDGGPSSGAEGIAGGGGGATEQQITKLVETFSNSRVTINLDATASMGGHRDAVARALPEILGKVQSGTISVKVFRDILEGQKNEVVIKATPRTRDPSEIDRMVRRVLKVETEGGGDLAETGYQLVIQNMKTNPHGTELRPNVEFIITDAPERQPELLQEMLGLMGRTKTRVFVYTTTDGSCTEIK